MINFNSLRFDFLDGLRGIAAIAVMIYHFSQQVDIIFINGAWVFVDLFFVLSGFVIAFNYSEKILTGLTFAKFLKIRLIRLAPLYVVGLIIGFVALTTSKITGDKYNGDFSEACILFLYGFFWIPVFNKDSIFPLNNPAWSLFFELFINLSFFWFLKFHKATPKIFIIGIAFIIYLAASLVFTKINPGWSAENFIFGFPRVVFEFLFGVFVYSSGLYKKTWNKYLSALILFLSVIFIFVGNHKLSFVNSIIFIPLVVVIASSIKCNQFSKKICKIFGDLSYPIYAIHFPLFLFFNNIEIFFNLDPMIKIFIASVLCILFSVFISRADFSVRNKLTTKFI